MTSHDSEKGHMPFHRLNEALRAAEAPCHGLLSLASSRERYNMDSGGSTVSYWGQWGSWALLKPTPPQNLALHSPPALWVGPCLSPTFSARPPLRKQKPERWKEIPLRLPSSFML